VRTKVNVEASEQALRDLRDVHTMGTETLQALATQAEQIDRIETGVESIHGGLDKTHKILKGIESLPSYIGNALAKKDKGKSFEAVPSKPERIIAVPTSKPSSLSIEILCKLPNDNLVEAILRIEDDSIRCINPVTEKLLSPDYVYYYSEISHIIMRARPEHCDLRFKPISKKQRFRLMSSYLQVMTNEIKLRAPNSEEIEVIFEAGIRPFEYNHISISIQPVLSRQQVTSGFFRSENQLKLSNIIQTDDEETKTALQKVDRNLDEISKILGHVGSMAKVTGEELSRQNEQLDRVNRRVDEATDRLDNTNRRIERVIND